MIWPWRRNLAEAERRLAEANERVEATQQLVQYSREVDEQLRRTVRRNGFGEAIQLAMRGRRA